MDWYVLGLVIGLVLFMAGLGLKHTATIIMAVIILVVTIFAMILLDPKASDHQRGARDTHATRERAVVLQPCVRDCHNYRSGELV